jgi:hypothetical protein
VLTPFKLLPFFPVRVRFGVVLVDCNLVEVLVGIRVIRKHVGWSHFLVNAGKDWDGGESALVHVGKLVDSCFLFRNTMIG